MTIEINGVDYSTYLLEKPEIAYRKQFDSSDLTISQVSIKLDNTENIFSDMNPISIFYGIEPYDLPVELFDDSGDSIFFGILRDIQDDAGKTVTLICFPHSTLATEEKVVCDISGTPSNVILQIMSSGITQLRFNRKSFSDTNAYNQKNGDLIHVKETIQDNRYAVELCQEIAALYDEDLYEFNGEIYLTQREPYAGAGGIFIDNRFMIAGSIKTNWDDRNILNAFDVKLFDSAAPSTPIETNGSDSASQKKYNRVFTYQKDYSIDLTAAGNTGIAITSTKTALTNRMAKKIQMRKEKARYLEFSTFIDYKFLKIDDIVFVLIPSKGYYNEPFQIYGMTFDNENRNIRFIAYALNLSPKFLDMTTKTYPPSKVIGFVAKVNGSTINLNWQLNSSTENIRDYIIYYGQDIDYDGWQANNGVSPLSVSSATNSLALSFANFTVKNSTYFYDVLNEGVLKIAIAARNKSGILSELSYIDIGPAFYGLGGFGDGYFGDGYFGEGGV